MTFIKTIVLPLVLLLTAGLPLAGSAQPTFTSAAQQTQLIELYTSEGCSSCPPADRWLRAFKAEPSLWREVVPVAFHVDYWNYLGWPDPFATKAYSDRQRKQALARNLSHVYTPGFIVDGREWKGWFAGQPRPSQHKTAPGKLQLSLTEKGYAAAFSPEDFSAKKARLTVAVLGSNLTTRVKAGENSGRTLQHDFVVLGLTTAQAKLKKAFHWRDALPQIDPQWLHNDQVQFAVVAWVSANNALAPSQAVGGWVTQAQLLAQQ